MGLFSKLKDLANDPSLDKLKNAAMSVVKEAAQNIDQQTARPVAAAQTGYAEEDEADTPSGFSWGPKMPDEENQYNFNGHYGDYFEQIYRSEFPQYQVKREKYGYGDGVIFTFEKDGSTALITEVMSDSTGAQKTRDMCRKQNIPYLRFYHDHEGWWNTKAYVIKRTNDALS
ncbi:MAG: hypothetical protein K6G69_04395 [Lachnospiraceae bacterium]|nr:hypothetical protein [Lachnospiraceae bacterium]